MKNYQIPVLALLLIIMSCSKRNDHVASPVTKSHTITFNASGSGYKVVLSLQKSGTSSNEIISLDTIYTTSATYAHTLTLNEGEHLLVTISPGIAPETHYQYSITENNDIKDQINVGNVAQGSELTFHYPNP